MIFSPKSDGLAQNYRGHTRTMAPSAGRGGSGRGGRLIATEIRPPMSDLCRLIWCALLGLFSSQTAFLRRQLNVPRSFIRWSIK
jgi:hypothetical protein